MTNAEKERTCQLRFKWRREAADRWGLLIVGGQFDCYAYAVKYQAVRANMYGWAWCWILTKPRGSAPLVTGWATSALKAKLQVEKEVVEL